MRITLTGCCVFVLLAASSSLRAIQDRSDQFLFACSVFAANTTEESLQTRFGRQNVTRGLVTDPHGAEGDLTEGALLFANDAEARLEISWTDVANRRQPAIVRTLAPRGRWHTSSGIMSGTDLKTVEALNGRPFVLTGLNTDVQGTVVSWRGGRLEAQDSADCHVRIRLRMEISRGPAAIPLERQVTGDRDFSSGHPAMQALNPTVYELSIWYGQRVP